MVTIQVPDMLYFVKMEGSYPSGPFSSLQQARASVTGNGKGVILGVPVTFTENIYEKTTQDQTGNQIEVSTSR